MKAPTKTPISSASPPSIHLLRFSRALLPSAAASSPKIFAKQSCKHSGEKTKRAKVYDCNHFKHTYTIHRKTNDCVLYFIFALLAVMLTGERTYWWGQPTEAAGLIILIDSIWSLLGHRGKSPFVGDLISTPTEPILSVCSQQLREKKINLPSHVKWWCDSWTCDFGSWGFQINKVFFPLHALHFAHWLLHI